MIGVALHEAHPERVEQHHGDPVGARRRVAEQRRGQPAGRAGEQPLDGGGQRGERVSARTGEFCTPGHLPLGSHRQAHDRPDPPGTRGRLRLVNFANAQRLQKDGTSTFTAPADMPPQQAELVHVIQGTVEQSNVKPVVEMARLIEVSRAYTQLATLLQQHGDIRRSAIERLAEVPA